MCYTGICSYEGYNGECNLSESHCPEEIINLGEIKMLKEKIEELLLSTSREGMDRLLKHMDDNGFFTAPCSSQYHLCKEEGLAIHSMNVHDSMFDMAIGLKFITELRREDEEMTQLEESIHIVSLLHDLGKMGQYNKPNYVENILKSGKKSDSKPYEINKDLLHIPHEVRSIQIASQFIELTEEEQFAIMYHADVAGDFKYIVANKQRPLQLLLFMADYWSAKVTEV